MPGAFFDEGAESRRPDHLNAGRECQGGTLLGHQRCKYALQRFQLRFRFNAIVACLNHESPVNYRHV